MNQAKPVVVVGEGWAALAAVGTLLTAETGASPVVWISGAGSRIIAPLPSLESSTEAYGAVEALIELSTKLGIEIGQERSGNFLREFKNKAFREPVWTESPRCDEPSERRQARTESLWDPERVLPNLFDTRFELTLAEIEERIREKLTIEAFPSLCRIEGNHLAGVKIKDGKLGAAILASGDEIECESLIYADRWSALPKVQGLPKSMGFTRHRDPHGVLQVTFTHKQPVGLELLEGFYGSMTREAGEEFERHVWGYFSSDGMKSYWTVCFSADEVEDNHEIAKKLRRMKSTLDKMFVGSAWCGEKGFMSSVSDEQVRFEESFFFASADAPTEVTRIAGIENLSFLTDGYGPSSSFQQVRVLFSGVTGNSSAESKNAHHADSAQL